MKPKHLPTLQTFGRIGFHLFVFALVLPYVGAFAFLFGKYLIRMPEQSVGVSLGAAALGAVAGTALVFVFSFGVAFVWIPVLLFGGKWTVFGSSAIGLPIAAWTYFAILNSDSFFREDWPLLAAVVIFLSFLTGVAYAAFDFHSLFLQSAISENEQ